MFWVISVQFDLRNALPKLGPFLLGHAVYIHTYINTLADIELCLKQESSQKYILYNIFTVIKYNGEFPKTHIASS